MPFVPPYLPWESKVSVYLGILSEVSSVTETNKMPGWLTNKMPGWLTNKMPGWIHWCFRNLNNWRMWEYMLGLAQSCVIHIWWYKQGRKSWTYPKSYPFQKTLFWSITTVLWFLNLYLAHSCSLLYGNNCFPLLYPLCLVRETWGCCWNQCGLETTRL